MFDDGLQLQHFLSAVDRFFHVSAKDKHSVLHCNSLYVRITIRAFSDRLSGREQHTKKAGQMGDSALPVSYCLLARTKLSRNVDCVRFPGVCPSTQVNARILRNVFRVFHPSVVNGLAIVFS